MSDDARCSHCGFPISSGDSVRHFGLYVAHHERQCLNLLRTKLTVTEDELALEKKRLDWRLKKQWVRVRAVDDGFECRQITEGGNYADGELLGSGETERAAIDDAMAKAAGSKT